MISFSYADRRWVRLSTLLRFDDSASQIVEFALSVPLLVFFIIGIFDFSGALALKHKLADAAREGARIAATDPANDLASGGTPVSASDALQVVDSYLLSENLNDCQLNNSPLNNTAGTLTWTATANTKCPGGAAPGIQLTINRGCVNSESVTEEGGQAETLYLVGTCVTISYPYVWQFSGPSGLFGGKFIGPTSITTSAMAFNEN
jgi:Flp pilus assembly protein TadG